MRGLLMAVPYIFALVCRWNETESFVVFPLGIALILAAFLIRFWAQLHLHYRLKAVKYLTTTGPYKYVRNPIYVANIILLSGYVLMSELVWFIPVSIVYGYVVYRIVVAYEEFYLKRKYGAPYI
jgi:protein-S-isoprenylcysteine O-methyltransferase Ste14